MINILMIIPALYCGGGLQKIALQLSQELILRGYNIIVVDKHSPPLENLNYLKELPVFEKIKSYKTEDPNYNEFNSIIEKHKVDVIIYHGFFKEVNLFLKKWDNKIRIPIISEYHNTPDAPLPKGKNSIPRVGIKNKIKRAFYSIYYLYSTLLVQHFLSTPTKFSKRIVLLSNNFIKLYKDLSKTNPAIEVIPNFVYSSYTTNLERKKQLLYVGRLEESQKHFSRILKIWQVIHEKYTDWTLVVAGRGKCMNEYQEYVRKNHINNIVFLGHVVNTDSLYRNSEITLMTSDYEGFSLVLIEAMANGSVPIAYGSFESIIDIIDSGKNGIIIPPFNEDLYLTELEKLMTDEKYRKQLSDGGIIKARQFSPEIIANRWEKLLGEVCIK